VTFQDLIGVWAISVIVSALFLGEFILARGVSFPTWCCWCWGAASAIFFVVNGAKRVYRRR
jgi:hypothetical protein